MIINAEVKLSLAQGQEPDSYETVVPRGTASSTCVQVDGLQQRENKQGISKLIELPLLLPLRHYCLDVWPALETSECVSMCVCTKCLRTR